MADTKISLLTAVTTPSSTVEVGINEAGTSKKMTVAQIRANVGNTAVAAVSGYAADTYLVGSSIAIPSNSLKAKSIYYCVFNVVKTAAGAVAPIINIRFGTTNSISDASRGVLTFALQTAVVDEGIFEVWATFNSVGATTSAVIQSAGKLAHRLSITGLSTDVTGSKIATSAGFDSTVASSIIGLSVNGGTLAAWTITLVQAQLINLA